MTLDSGGSFHERKYMTNLGISITCIVVIALALGSSCTREPNQKEGIIELTAATGSIAVSPGDLKKLKEKMPLGGNGESRSYMKSGGKETVKLSGSESNTVAFETGSSPGAVDVRIKGSKKFVDNTISEVEDIIGVKASLSLVQLIAETKTYPGFKESHVTALEEELGKTMTSLGRSKSSFNGSATIKSAFEKGLNEVRLKLSEEYSALKVTIEGNGEFVEGIKSLLNKIKKTTPTEA